MLVSFLISLNNAPLSLYSWVLWRCTVPQSDAISIPSFLLVGGVAG